METGDFTTSDLVAAFRDGGYEQRGLVALVPEPSSSVILITGLMAAAFYRQRRRDS